MTSLWKFAIRLSSLNRNDKTANLDTNFKHEKLFEELSTNDNADVESTFYCQYLGSIPVESPSGSSTNAQAIRQMMFMSRHKNTKSIALTILPNKIIMKQFSSTINNDFDNNNNNDDDDDDKYRSIIISLNRISYCFVDSTYKHVIAFVATNDDGCHECHAFMVSKTKSAKLIALTISKAFINAYDRWLQQKKIAGSSSSSSVNNNNNNNMDNLNKNNDPELKRQKSTTIFNNNNNEDWFDFDDNHLNIDCIDQHHDKQLLIFD